MTIQEIKELLQRNVRQLRDANDARNRLTGAVNKLRIGAICESPNHSKLWFAFYSAIRNPAENTGQLYGPWLRSEVAKCFELCRDFVNVEFGAERSSNEEAGAVKVTFTATEDLQPTQRLEESLTALQQFLNSFKDRTNWPSINDAIKSYNKNHTEELDEYCQRFRQQDPLTPLPPLTPQPPKGNSQMITQIRSLLEANLNVILTGAPGTGKTFTAKKVAYAITGDTDSTSQEESHIAFVQFHPGYDYSDFVIGMKPRLEGGQVAFDWEDGIFKEFADKSRKAYDDAPDKENVPKFVFLIDEINRADLSRVFGELFSLLEEEYRYPNEHGTGITLPNGESFVIPKNLYIIGTMNDIDRSVESMDFALRRRFAWYEVTADSSIHIIKDKVSDKDAVNKKLESAMTSLNACISGKKSLKVEDETIDLGRILGSAFELGGAIFAKYQKYKGDDDAYGKLWDNHIKNILSEYLRGRPGRDEKLLPALRKIFDAAIKDANKKEENPKSEENVSESNAHDSNKPQQN